jgi:hypothetical protein
MPDHPIPYERLADFFTISESSKDHIEQARDKIKNGKSVAFLVTSDLSIHIGDTGLHADIYRDFPIDRGGGEHNNVIEKGQIVGMSKKINFYTSDTWKSHEIKPEDIQKLQAIIKDKINDFLALDFYLK